MGRMKVCRLPPSHQGYDLSSPSNNRLTENELFGCEFLEPADLNKALRESSASLSGVKTRFRSKPRSLRTPKPTGCPDFRVSCNFSEARIADSMSGVCTNLFFRDPPRARLLVRSCSERTVAPKLLWSFSDDMSHWRQCRKRARRRKHVKWFAGSGGVTQWPRQHCTPSSHRLGYGSCLRSVFPEQS